MARLGFAVGGEEAKGVCYQEQRVSKYMMVYLTNVFVGFRPLPPRPALISGAELHTLDPLGEGSAPNIILSVNAEEGEGFPVLALKCPL